MRTVEGMDESAIRHRRPPVRLYGAAHLQRQLVEAEFPLARLEPLLAPEAPQVAVGADVVEAVVVHAHVGEVPRHAGQGPLTADVEKLLGACRVVLQQRRSELEALRPLRPSTRAIPALDGEYRRAVLGLPRVFDREDLPG